MKFFSQSLIKDGKVYDLVSVFLSYHDHQWELTFHTVGFKCSVIMNDAEFEETLSHIYQVRRDVFQ
jgi:hypothetical protein